MAGKRVGLVIGNNYENSEKELQFAVADAFDIKRVLEHKDICGFDNVVYLPNKTSKEASIELERLLKKAGPGDLIFIYFSGNGKKDFTNGLYLLFKDTDEETPLATSLTFDFINKCRKYPLAKQASVVVVLDCCYSGYAEIRDPDVEEAISDYSGPGTVILTSTGSTGSRTAKEDKTLGHGIFTHYLLEGLNEGHADRIGKGHIYIDDLYQYAYEMTIKRCTQSPKKGGNIEGSIFIGRNPQKIRENEYRVKTEKLLDIDELSGFVLNVSLNVLKKEYSGSSELTSEDKRILKRLESLLKGKLSTENYETAVRHIKRISEPAGNTGIKVAQTPQISRNTKALEVPKTFTSPFTGMEFILIPEGEFLMGSLSKEQGRYDDESPIHNVQFKNPFYMGKYPVTQKQWVAVMGDNPSNFKGDDLPVEKASWDDALEFIKKLNEKEKDNKYRLPSEVEWEYACRAETTTRYSFGDDDSKLGDYAWNADNSGGQTHPVGQKKHNPWDLYDMHGNVWEWVQDEWHSDYNGASSDGSAWENGNSSTRVIRGGGWDGLARDCRSAIRSRLVASYRYVNVGFRLLRKL